MACAFEPQNLKVKLPFLAMS